MTNNKEVKRVFYEAYHKAKDARDAYEASEDQVSEEYYKGRAKVDELCAKHEEADKAYDKVMEKTHAYYKSLGLPYYTGFAEWINTGFAEWLKEKGD